MGRTPRPGRFVGGETFRKSGRVHPSGVRQRRARLQPPFTGSTLGGLAGVTPMRSCHVPIAGGEGDLACRRWGRPRWRTRPTLGCWSGCGRVFSQVPGRPVVLLSERVVVGPAHDLALYTGAHCSFAARTTEALGATASGRGAARHGLRGWPGMSGAGGSEPRWQAYVLGRLWRHPRLWGWRWPIARGCERCIGVSGRGSATPARERCSSTGGLGMRR